MKRSSGFALLAVLGLAGVLLAVAVGPGRLPVPQVFAQLWRPQVGTREALIVWGLRLPRALAGYLAGAALALAGGVMQGLFKNPLASPYVLGVAGGAAAGAAGTIALGGMAPWGVPLGAAAGGLLAVGLAWWLSRPARGELGLILVGVALGALFSSVTGLVLFLTAGDRRFQEILFWTMGGLWRAAWAEVHVLAGVVIVGTLVLSLWGRRLNALALGEEGARHLGLHPGRLRGLLIAAATLLAATAVAFCGTIGFVGLITPHVVRLLVGPDHRVLLPAAALAGGLFLVLADTLARVALAPMELPVGIVTGLLGVPFFLYLVRRRAR